MFIIVKIKQKNPLGYKLEIIIVLPFSFNYFKKLLIKYKSVIFVETFQLFNKIT